MSTKNPTNAIERLIVPAITRIAKLEPYWTKKEVLSDVMRDRGMVRLMKDLGKFQGFRVGEIVTRYTEGLITEALHARNSDGVRIYEAYKADGEYRWMPLLRMNAAILESVHGETHDQEVSMRKKGNQYHIFAKALRAAGPGATVADVYADVIDEVRAARA